MTTTPTPTSPLGQPAVHDSALRHTTGEALYVDDIPVAGGCLHGMIVASPHAHAKILSRDATAARAMPGVREVLFVEDVPGDNMIGAIIHDEPLFATDQVHFVGQTVALVIATSLEACHAAAAAVEVEYEPLPATLSLREAVERESFHTAEHAIRRGDVAAALGDAHTRISGESASGYQDHFYLETHAALALPLEDGNLHVYSSTQHPSEVQKLIALVCDLGAHKVVCEVPRMGGAFGGKESQASIFACLASLGAQRTGRPVKVWLDRDQDMTWTGKRHPFWSRWEAGFDAEGRLVAFDVEIYSDGGWTVDLSGPVHDRALFHLDNAYFIPNLSFRGRVARTNTISNTAFRGFGGPQGMLVVEDALNRYAEAHGEDPAEVRRRNFYGDAPRNVAPYGQLIEDCRLQRIWDELMDSSDYAARRAQVDAFNAGSRFHKRGIAFQPVKFGISFTKSVLNQAGALVLVYTDGTVQLNHGGTEMGQGLHVKMITVCAHGLGLPAADVRIMNTATDKVPNTSATAASSGSDLNGQAVEDACRTLRDRMRPVAAQLLGLDPVEAADITFSGGQVGLGDRTVSFREVASACWASRVSLAATGFYGTPGVAYSHETGSGRPFYYYAYGASVVELEVSGLTGEMRILRADLLHDVGASLVPTIDIGQVEGAFVQGVGWLTDEELLLDDAGRVITSGPSTYKIPAVGDVPLDLRVHLLERAPQPGVIHGSKAVGEPPFMLAIAVVTALRHAIGAFGAPGEVVDLTPPCTPETILRAIVDQRSRGAGSGQRTDIPARAS